MKLRRKTPRERQIERFLARLELTGDAELHDMASPGCQLRVALTTASPSGILDPDRLVRPDYSGYHDAAPQEWEPASWGSTRNASEVEFGVCATGSATIVGFAVYTANPGVVIASGAIDPPLTFGPGATPMFAAGALTVTLS